MTSIFHIVRFDPSLDTFLEGFVGENAKDGFDQASARLSHWEEQFPTHKVGIVRKA